MLYEVKSFITGYPDKIGFRFDDNVFLRGLKFSTREKYPWKSRKEMRGFFEKLYSHKAPESYQKIIEWKTALHQEQTHVYYSWALLLRFSSLIMIAAGGILIALSYVWPSVVFASAGIVMLLSNVCLLKMATRARQSWITITGLLNTLLKQPRQDHIEAA
jgi:hypothetical protein